MTPDMTPEQLRVAVAEAMGYERITVSGKLQEVTGWTQDPTVMLTSRYIYTHRNGWHYCRIPNYTGSLDAMADAEKTLTGAQWTVYLTELAAILGLESLDYGYTYRELGMLVSASAEQRARAFRMVRNRG